MTLDYRFPDTGPPRAQQVATKLAMEEASDWIGFAVRLAVGIPLSFLPSAVLASMVARRALWLSWLFIEVFLWASVLLVPVMFCIERYRKQHFELHIAETGPEHDWGFLLDVLLVGPGLVWGILDQYRARDAPDDELRAIAAGVVVELLDANQPVPLSRFISDDRRTAEGLSRALRYLEHRGWIGIPRRRDRVWLNDSIRKELTHLQ